MAVIGVAVRLPAEVQLVSVALREAEDQVPSAVAREVVQVSTLASDQHVAAEIAGETIRVLVPAASDADVTRKAVAAT